LGRRGGKGFGKPAAAFLFFGQKPAAVKLFGQPKSATPAAKFDRLVRAAPQSRARERLSGE
jgi:hypothetical protein